MFITKTLSYSNIWRMYTFPYKIGDVSPEDNLGKFWRPCNTDNLSGGHIGTVDPFAATEKLAAFGQAVRETGYPIERIDSCHNRSDSIEIKLSAETDQDMVWDLIEDQLSQSFCLDVQ